MYIDLIAGIILILTILIGLKKGFFFEVLSFFILILNVVLAKRWTPYLYSYLKGNIQINETLLYYLSYVIILFMLYIVTSIILSVLRRNLPKMFMGLIDSVLGGILGGLKGVFIIFVLLVAFNLLTNVVPQIKEYSKGSRVNEFFLEKVTKLEEYYPEVLQKKIEEFQLQEKIDTKIKEYMSK